MRIFHNIIKKYLFIFIGVISVNYSLAQNLVISSVSGNTNESGTEATFTVGLDAPQTGANTTITITSLNTAEVTVSPASITFAVGESNALEVTVTGVNDFVIDGDQVVDIEFTTDVNYLGTAPSNLSITNEDNDGTVSIEATIQAAEETSNGLFTFTATTSSTSATIINFDITGTAGNGADYNPISAWVELPAGETSVTLPITVVGDNDIEGDETVILTLTSTDNGDLTVGSPNTATITITDDDSESVSIVATTQALESGTDGLFTITATNSFGTDTEISYTVTGTATPDADYTVLTGSATLLAGQTEVTIPVAIISDALVEGDETVILTLTSTDNGDLTVGSPNTATVTITDDDSESVSIVATTQALESGTDGLFTITATNSFGTDTEISYTVTGTATPDADYTALTGSATLLAGQTEVTIPVAIISDVLVEGDETVILTLTSTDNGDLTVGSPNTATITITDDDSESVNIVATTQALESGTNGLFTITATNSFGTDTDISYTVTGTATPDADYTALTGTATLIAGQTEVIIPVAILSDVLVEGDESVIVTLNSTN
ncbi:beta strand repeat-containing protein, partial [Carboxylicivirga sp. N1Y90]|uniref:beta strand repeat-containing protein n=1 Tax=Carboxylicivirga fragile TaxID=3417571 RepID=UPI003D3420A6|nr:hypothetical protein [Marinilabiliaceae bacterium N1Y90]